MLWIVSSDYPLRKKSSISMIQFGLQLTDRSVVQGFCLVLQIDSSFVQAQIVLSGDVKKLKHMYTLPLW